MRQAIFVCAVLGFVLAPAHAQVRSPEQQFTEIDLLFNILTATVNGIDIDDPAVLQANFEGLSFSDFDRDRDGAFMTFGGALGLFDLTLAIRQFNHDPVDADGDGLIGFYELECEYAGGGLRLDPNTAETTAGIPDGTADCDGDGSPNLAEVNAGTNPLDPNDFPVVDFEVVNPGVEIHPLAAASSDGTLTITLEPDQTIISQDARFTLEGEFVQ